MGLFGRKKKEENTEEIEIKFQQHLDKNEKYKAHELIEAIVTQQKYQLALKILPKMIDWHKQNNDIYFKDQDTASCLKFMGFCHMKLGDNTKAIDCFDKASEINTSGSDSSGMEEDSLHEMSRWKAVCLFEGKIDVEKALRDLIKLWAISQKKDDLAKRGIDRIFKTHPELKEKYSET